MRRSARLPPAGSLVFVPLVFAPRAPARGVLAAAVALPRIGTMETVLRPADAASTLSLLSELLRVGRLAVVAGHDVPLVRVGFGARTYTLRFGVRWNAAQGSYAKTSIERQPASKTPVFLLTLRSGRPTLAPMSAIAL